MGLFLSQLKGGIFMKSYHELVKDYIKKSKKSLNQIVEDLKKEGVEKDKYYLSKLQNGKVQPAEEDFNKAFAKVTNNDPNPLMFASYIERTPEDVRYLLDQMSAFSMLLDAMLITFDNGYQLKNLVNENIKEELLEQGISLNDNNYIEDIKTKLTLIEKWNLFVFIQDNADVYSIGTPEEPELLIDVPSVREELNPNKGNPNSLSSIFGTFVEDIETRTDWDIPILKHLYNKGTFEDNDYLGVETMNRFDLDNQTAYILEAYDYGMSKDGIKKGDYVLTRFVREVEPTDIAVVAIKDKPSIIRRVQFHENCCILRPSNPVMKLSIHEKSEVEILGKVIEVRQRRKIK